eukprot:gene10523-12246_t
MSKTISTLQKSLFFLFLLSGNFAFSQITPLNTIDVNAIYIPDSKYKQADGAVQNTRKTQQRINLGYTFLISQKLDTATKKMSRWTGMINAGYTKMSNKTDEKDLMPNRLLNSEFGISYYRSMKGKWGMLSILSAGINSDLQKVDVHDLFVNGGVFFVKTKSPQFSWGFGVFVSNALNSPLIMPGIIMQWQTEDKLKFYINPPFEVSAAYDMSKKVELKLAFRPRNLNYDIENLNEPKRRSLTYWELPLGLETKLKGKHFDLMLGGGYMFLRSFQLKENGLKNAFKSAPNNSLGGNVFFNAGIRYKLQLPKK